MGRPLNLILLLLLVVCGVSLWLAQGRPLPEFLSSPEIKPGFESPGPVATREEPVHLKILNGTEMAGLAGEVALLVTRLGCVVEGVGNAAQWPGSVSVLINRRLTASEAKDLALRLGGIPVLQEWDGRTTEDAVLILGQDHQEITAALRSIVE